jgi:hypothetical protein
VQSEKSRSWGVEFVAQEFEILDPWFVFGAVQFADLGRDEVPARKNQHELSCCSPEVQCVASSFSAL